MALVLARYPFTADDWDEVQSFDCGEKEHQREVSDWIKGPADPIPNGGSALAELNADPPARILLYLARRGWILIRSVSEAAPPDPSLTLFEVAL